jgi:hypothetical protein
LKNKITYLLTGLLILTIHVSAQEGLKGLDRLNPGRSNTGRPQLSNSGNDSLKHRNINEDSLTIRFRYLDSTRFYTFDSSMNDFTLRYPVPATFIHLGNTGTAARSHIFSPSFIAGWDPGTHAFDIYKWTVEKARFFSTTRPYSEMNYLLGSRSEQLIELMHTQNVRPNWNVALQYRLINAPGFYKNQKANHNNYTITSWYKSNNQRYNNYFLLVANKLQSAEGGGLADQTFLDSVDYKDRFNLDTKIGGDDPFGTNFFSTKIGTGSKQTTFTALLRQQYDLGRKDSIVTDSTVIPLFYPRLRFEHTISYNTYKYVYNDASYSGNTGVYEPDSTYYADNYKYTITPGDSLYFRDRWKELVNDFSIYQFPDAKNQNQFIKLGAAIQNMNGEFTNGKKNFYNVFGHAEYRNKSRNLKWDIQAHGKLYFTGLNAGDYHAFASIQGLIGKKIGYLQLGFENVNRTPSFIFDSRSSYAKVTRNQQDFKKENTTHLFASFQQPKSRLQLTGDYYLLTNYTYIDSFSKLQQHDALFNVLQIGLHKTVKLGRRWNWHADIYFQQVVGDAPVNVPTIFTRNRIAYEGNLGFKNLAIAFGAEVRYHTPYKADGYSPVLGRYFYQKDTSLSNLPETHLYMHFRIKGIKIYLRAENLHTVRNLEGFGFTNNSMYVPGYAYPGLVIRFGVFWSFVN